MIKIIFPTTYIITTIFPIFYLPLAPSLAIFPIPFKNITIFKYHSSYTKWLITLKFSFKELTSFPNKLSSSFHHLIISPLSFVYLWLISEFFNNINTFFMHDIFALCTDISTIFTFSLLMTNFTLKFTYNFIIWIILIWLSGHITWMSCWTIMLMFF